MEQGNSSIRDRLLARLPRPENLAAYQKEVAEGLSKKEKRLRWERWGSRAVWIFAGSYVLYLLNRGEQWFDTPKAHLSMCIAFLLLFCGAVELVKHFINRSRVELLKEIKQVQLQVLELQASLQKAEEK